MEIGKIRYFKNAKLFRAWLAKNYNKQDHAWVLLYKKHAEKPSMTYAEALDEALCYGWIDGILKRIDDEKHVIRFTPRRPSSVWSKHNLGHIQRLMSAGKMRAPGRAVLPAALLEQLAKGKTIRLTKSRSLKKQFGVKMY